jgi:hypothetical protein
MTQDEVDSLAYVAALAPAIGLPLDAEARAAVAAAFALIRRIAAPALDRAVPDDIEPAPVFTP